MAQSKRERQESWKKRTSESAKKAATKPAKSYKDKSSSKKESSVTYSYGKAGRDTHKAGEERKTVTTHRGSSSSKHPEVVVRDIKSKSVLYAGTKAGLEKQLPTVSKSPRGTQTTAAQDARARTLGRGAKMSPELAAKLYGKNVPKSVTISKGIKNRYTIAHARKIVGDVAKTDDVRQQVEPGRFDPAIHTHISDYSGLIPTPQSMVSGLVREKQLEKYIGFKMQPLTSLEMTGGTIPVEFSSYRQHAPFIGAGKDTVVTPVEKKKYDPVSGFLASLETSDTRVSALLPETEKIEKHIKGAVEAQPWAKPLKFVSGGRIDAGEIATGVYEGIKEKPVTAALTAASFYIGVPAVLGLGAKAWKGSRAIATAKRVPYIGGAVRKAPTVGGYAIGGIYGVDVIRRVATSEERGHQRELGYIIGSEILPMGVGAYAGRARYANIGKGTKQATPYKTPDILKIKTKKFELAPGVKVQVEGPRKLKKTYTPPGDRPPKVSVISEKSPEHGWFTGKRPRVSIISEKSPEYLFKKPPKVKKFKKTKVEDEWPEVHIIEEKVPKHLKKLKSLWEEESGSLSLQQFVRQPKLEVRPQTQLSQSQLRRGSGSQVYSSSLKSRMRQQHYSQQFDTIKSRFKIDPIMKPLSVSGLILPFGISSRMKEFQISPQHLQQLPFLFPVQDTGQPQVQMEEVVQEIVPQFDIIQIQRTEEVQDTITETRTRQERIGEEVTRIPRTWEIGTVPPPVILPLPKLKPKKSKKKKAKSLSPAEIRRLSIERWIGSPEAALYGVAEKMPNILTIQSEVKTVPQRRRTKK